MGQASVAKSGPSGQVFTQTYLPWTGTLKPRWARNYAVYRHHMLGLVKSGHRPWPILVRVYLVLVLIGSIGDIFPVLLGSLFGDGLGQVFMVSRDSLYAHARLLPEKRPLLPGGHGADCRHHDLRDRLNGTSALYFSRPITRLITSP